jgi:hypothetical protein
MSAANSKRPIQIHEYAWGAFLCLGAVEVVRTFIKGTTPAVALLWLPLLAGLVASAWATRQPGVLVRRIGYAYFPLAMNAAYFAMGPIVRAATDWRADDLLQNMDDYLVGSNLSLKLQPYISSATCDAFSVGYMWFLVLLPLFYAGYLIKGKDLERCYRGLFLLYSIGFSCYILLPAAGPYIAMASQFHTLLHGSFLTTFNLYAASTGSNHVDVFPSLHVGVSVFIWLTLIKDYRRLALLNTPLLLLLWGSTIFLRFHYATDVICGASLAVFCFWFTAVESNSTSKIRNILNGRAAL